MIIIITLLGDNNAMLGKVRKKKVRCPSNFLPFLFDLFYYYERCIIYI